MPNMAPDPALDTYLAGRFGTPKQGYVAPAYMRNPSLSTTLAAGPDTGIRGSSSTLWVDTANNDAPVTRIETVNGAGVVTVQWIDTEGNVMSFSPSFSQAVVEIKAEPMYATFVGFAPNMGEVRQVERHSPFRNGALVAADVKYFDMNANPPVDVTATVTGADWRRSEKPVRIQLQGVSLAVVGAGPFALPPTLGEPTYAEVYVDADGSGIRWTKDGTVPADNNGEQDAPGSTIYLQDRDEITGFGAAAIDGNGVLDAAGTANLTVNYWNIAPDED